MTDQRGAVIQVLGLASGEPTEAAYQYVESYTPDGNGGRGDLVLTPHVDRAKVYHDHGVAMGEWKRTSRTHPTRHDGKPNRPMTAFTVTVLRAPRR